jgi:hypothetical protein
MKLQSSTSKAINFVNVVPKMTWFAGFLLINIVCNQGHIIFVFYWQFWLLFGRILERGVSGGLLVCCVEIRVHLFHCQKVSGKVIIMEAERNDQTQDEKVMESNFMEIQRLVIKVNALSSTTSFALETMAQHRVLVGQLQDEIDFLRQLGKRGT